jgi:predicted membrane channel-forming protein YqfA (hemolysin III family)
VTQRYIPGDQNPGLLRCENLEICIFFIFLPAGMKSAKCVAYFMYEAFRFVFVLITVAQFYGFVRQVSQMLKRHIHCFSYSAMPAMITVCYVGYEFPGS